MPSIEDTFLDLMREEWNEPSLTFDTALAKPLAKAVLAAMRMESVRDTPLPTPTPVPVTTPSPFSTSRAVIRAALEDTFTFETLKLDEAERDFLLRSSDIIVIAGERRLRLTDSARAKILDVARTTPLCSEMLQSAVREDLSLAPGAASDPARAASVWLRRMLSPDFNPGALDNPRFEELKAAQIARERLRLVTGLSSKLPTTTELTRRVGLAELLEPLRVLIGADETVKETNRKDRFVGRAEDLMRLRAFVDELDSTGVLEAARRWLSRAADTLSGSQMPRLLTIEGRGGLGKSALIAKFLLDHSCHQGRQFPFAYLDFDRASLDPQRPHQILLEITRQVALQYPEANAKFSELAAAIGLTLSRVSTSNDVVQSGNINDPYAHFVVLLKQYATFGERTFLLVLDTMETIQWNSLAMDRLTTLIHQFRTKGLDELRVVACGRADIPQLRSSMGSAAPTGKLEPLPDSEAREMADVLGGLAIGNRWRPEWSEAITRGRQSMLKRLLFRAPTDVRREPLAIRIAVDFIASAKDGKYEEAAEEVASLGIEEQKIFVERLYEKRMLNHIQNEDARKLAWPGLVIRRLTVEIVREILADVCEIPAEKALSAYTALGQEIWIVTPEGNALRHRPDLRARMLPLMRHEQGNLFNKVAARAVDYFAKHRERSTEDRVEWLYHRLLSGEDPKSVVRDTNAETLSILARAADDFAPDSLAGSYLVARTATDRLPSDRIALLTPNDAMLHLITTAQGVFDLNDTSLDPVALQVTDQIANEELDNSNTLWAQSLCTKTGAWRKLAWDSYLFRRPEERLDKSPEHDFALRMGVFWMTRSATLSYVGYHSDFRDFCSRIASRLEGEVFDFRTLVQVMALARIFHFPEFQLLDEHVSKLLREMRPDPAPSMQAALRTAIVLGEKCQQPALRLWLHSRRRGSQSEFIRDACVSLAELRALGIDPHERLPAHLENEPRRPIRITDPNIISYWLGTLEEKFMDHLSYADILAKAFACRQEDWIIPLAYSAQRLTPGLIPVALVERLNSYSISNGVHVDHDFVSAMRTADEAGDLAGFTQQILNSAEESETKKEFRHLFDCLRAWTDSINRGLESDQPSQEEETADNGDAPPAPGPIIHEDDLQKGRWGGNPERDGRRVSAVLESVERDIFYFSLVVESTDDSPLRAPVVFHLHDSYPRSLIKIRRIIDERRAELKEWNADGVFAIGVQVRNAKGQWIALELDLANLAGLPKRFLTR